MDAVLEYIYIFLILLGEIKHKQDCSFVFSFDCFFVFSFDCLFLWVVGCGYPKIYYLVWGNQSSLCWYDIPHF